MSKVYKYSLHVLCVFLVLPLVVNSGSVTLNWTAPGDDGETGMASVYDIRYSISAITEANWSAAAQVAGEPSPQIAGSSESHTVADLNSNTIYHFGIKTGDEVYNWSSLSNVVSIRTECDTTDMMRFDFNCSGTVDISDLVMMVDYMFGEGR